MIDSAQGGGPQVQADSLSRLLLAQSTACHWALDGNFEFLQVYGDCLNLFRATVDDLVGRHILEVVAPECRDRWSEKISKALGGEASSFGYSVMCGTDAVAYEVLLFPIHIKSRGAQLSLVGGLGCRIADQSGVQTEWLRFLHFLHDQVGQDLSVVGLQLEMLRMDAEPTLPSVGQRASQAQQTLECVLARVREFSEDLRRRLA